MNKPLLRLLSALWLGTLLLAGFRSHPVYAAGYVVTSLNDTIANDGHCTLREAIQEANNGPDTDCPGAPSASDDTITFSVSGTITLSATLPNIVSGQGALTIDGSGQTITISGNNLVRLMVVDSNATLTIQSLTMTDGVANAGAGISNAGTLTVNNSIFTGNNANPGNGGGIANASSGTVTVNNSIFSGNSAIFGGGISSDNNTVTISNSVFSGNSAQLGGGIYNNGGNVAISNSTFSGNSAAGPATFGGGGIANDGGTLTVTKSAFVNNTATGRGGGLLGVGFQTITNSTFVLNSAGSDGGALFILGVVTLNNNTIVNNAANTGGGIFVSTDTTPNVTIKNTIVANSTSGGNCAGPFLPGSANNLATDNSCGASFTQVTLAQLNFGPLTGSPAYLPLLSGSVAIDAGTSSGCPSTDQRGAARPQDGDNNSSAICDVGAYERSLQPVSYIVNTLNDNTTVDALCSLREAILAANDAPANADCGIGGAGDDTILFSVSGTITLGSTLPNIVSGQGALTINGSGQNITISGNDSVRVLAVNNGATLTLRSLTIANGRVTGSGGGVLNNGGTVTVLNSTFVRNTATLFGGGIENAGNGSLTVRDSFFDENSAQNGGAIDNDPGTLIVASSTFRGNSVTLTGGAIYSSNGAATIANSTFSGNQASDRGGGIYNSVNGTLAVVNATFWRNRANASGGGIYVNGGSVTVKNTIIANSTSGGNCFGAFAVGSATNLTTDTTCGSSFTQVTVAQLNFGPFTGVPGYFPLLPGSVAIDAGDNAVCAAAPVNNQSQNGVARPQNGDGDSLVKCDIGAVEAAFADLSATKTNNASGTATVGQPFTWTVTVANASVAAAAFASGQAIFRDDLPLGATYGTPVVQNLVNVTNGSNIACAIAGNTLTCTAAGGEVMLGAPASSFEVVVSVTPATTGTLVNPAAGGVCRVNPDGAVAEINEGNNSCTDTVTVNVKVYVPLVVRS